MKLRWIAVSLFAALLVRIPAITTLPLDWDEPIYLEAASEVSDALQANDWAGLANPSLNREHPGLVKVLYGASFVVHGSEATLIDRLASARGLSLVAGLGAVALCAWVHPVAGLALATHTLHAKYSTQAYLDSAPVLWMAFAMVVGWRSRERPGSRWMVVAAACWGAALAGKWLHGLPGLVLLFAVPTWRGRARLALIAGATVVLLDPSMWLDPWGRTTEMWAAHGAYAAALESPTQWWTPWWHLGAGGPSEWHPETFPFSVDGLWLMCAGYGLWCARNEPWGRYLGGWIGVPMALLMAWETRWPQHAMVVTVPISLAAALGARGLFSLASRRFGPNGSRRPTSA